MADTLRAHQRVSIRTARALLSEPVPDHALAVVLLSCSAVCRPGFGATQGNGATTLQEFGCRGRPSRGRTQTIRVVPASEVPRDVHGTSQSQISVPGPPA